MRCPYRLGRPYIWPKVENNGVFVFACVRFRLCAFSSVCVMVCVRFGSQNCVRFRLCALSSVFVFASVRFFHLPISISILGLNTAEKLGNKNTRYFYLCSRQI